MNRVFRVAALAAVISVVGCLHAQISPASPETRAMVKRVLTKKALNYQERNNVWIVRCSSKLVDPCVVLMAAADDVLIMGVVVAKKSELNLTPAVMQRLLSINNKLDRVKVGIDADGDLFARAELTLERLNDAELEKVLSLVLDSADKVAAVLK